MFSNHLKTTLFFALFLFGSFCVCTCFSPCLIKIIGKKKKPHFYEVSCIILDIPSENTLPHPSCFVLSPDFHPLFLPYLCSTTFVCLLLCAATFNEFASHSSPYFPYHFDEKEPNLFPLIFSIIFPIFITCHAYDFEVFPLDKMVFTSSSLLFLFKTLDLMHRFFFYWLASLLSAFGHTFIVSLMIYFHKGRVFMILWVVFKTGLQLNHAEG